jgi:ABC-type Fe3+-hydroxamate transport system substrate-binding protein
MCAMRTVSIFSLLFVPAALALTACSSDSPASPDSSASSSAAPASAAGGNGSQLADAVGKVIEVNGATAKVVCPDFKGQEGSTGASIGLSGDTVDCKATVTPADGPEYKTSIRVTWNDDEGHFTTAEQDD